MDDFDALVNRVLAYVAAASIGLAALYDAVDAVVANVLALLVADAAIGGLSAVVKAANDAWAAL